jgi:hypothetical protein
VATTLRHGNPARVEAQFVDGRVEQHPLGAVADLVTEAGNPGNRRGLAAVTTYLEAPLLSGGVELIDTRASGPCS